MPADNSTAEEIPSFDPFVGADDDDDFADGDLDASDRGDDIDGGDRGDAHASADEDDAPDEPVGLEQSAEEDDAAKDEADTDEPAAEDDSPEPEAEDDTPEPEADDLRIPKARLDREVRVRRAAEARIQELERALARQQGTEDKPPAEVAAPDLDLDPSPMFEAVLNGDTSAASETFRDIIKNVVASTVQNTVSRAEQLVEDRVSNTLSETSARSERTAVMEDVVGKYNVFDHTNSETYDDDLTQEVLALEAGFLSRNYRPGDALQAAVEYALKANRPELLEPEKPARPAPKLGADRQRQARVRAADAARRTPPETRGSTTPDLEDIDIDSLTDEQFDALPPETIKRLRGDFA